MASRGPILVQLADRLETIAGRLEGLVHDGLRDSQARLASGASAVVGSAVGRFLLLAVHGAAVLVRSAVDSLGGAVRIGGQSGVVADIFEDSVQKGWEGGDLAGAEEGKGMVLDDGGPVGRVGVERVKELLLDPVVPGRQWLAKGPLGSINEVQ